MNDIKNKRKHIINILQDNAMVEFVSVPIDQISKWFEGAFGIGLVNNYLLFLKPRQIRKSREQVFPGKLFFQLICHEISNYINPKINLAKGDPQNTEIQNVENSPHKPWKNQKYAFTLHVKQNITQSNGLFLLAMQFKWIYSTDDLMHRVCTRQTQLMALIKIDRWEEIKLAVRMTSHFI